MEKEAVLKGSLYLINMLYPLKGNYEVDETKKVIRNLLDKARYEIDNYFTFYINRINKTEIKKISRKDLDEAEVLYWKDFENVLDKVEGVFQIIKH